jgi:hypothetical protein
LSAIAAARSTTRATQTIGATETIGVPILSTMEHSGVATVLDKALRRQVAVDGVDYMVAVDPEGIRLTRKGRRRPEVELRWRELLSGEAAMAVALNASLSSRPPAGRAAAQPDAQPEAKPGPEAEPTPAARKRAGRRTARA